MDKVIESIETQIRQCEEGGIDPDEASWGYEQGVLLSVNEAKKILDALHAIKSHGRNQRSVD